MPVFVSASQITEAMDPETGRWGWRHLEKIKGKQSPQMEFGDLGHKEHELFYLSHGMRKHDLGTKSGKAAFAGLKYLPLPGPGIIPEGYMQFFFDGITYVGKIDLHFKLNPLLSYHLGLNSRAQSLGWNDKHLCVTDYKFTGDLKWMKVGDRLLHDPQRIIYATWSIHKYKHEWTSTRWLYHRRTPVKAEPSDFTEHREETLPLFPFVHEQALRIKAAHRKTIHDLPQNTQACYAWNRKCDYLDRCFPNGVPPVDQHVTSMFAQLDAADDRAQQRREMTTMSGDVFSQLGIAQPNGQAPSNGAPQGQWGPPAQGAPQGAPQGQWGPPAQQPAPQGPPQGQWGPPAQQAPQQQAAPQGQSQWGPPTQQQMGPQPVAPTTTAPQGQSQWGPPTQQPANQGQPQFGPPTGQAAPEEAPKTRKKKDTDNELTARDFFYGIAFLKGLGPNEAEAMLAQARAAQKG